MTLQRWKHVEMSEWLQSKRDVDEAKVKARRAGIQRREPFLPISSSRSLVDFQPRIAVRAKEKRTSTGSSGDRDAGDDFAREWGADEFGGDEGECVIIPSHNTKVFHAAPPAVLSRCCLIWSIAAVLSTACSAASL